MARRYCICTFWEKRGIVRDYFSYYIKALAEISEKVIVVVNGEITDEGRKTLLNIKNTEILQRENHGLDFGAYKAGIEYIGYENLNKYDELILTNCTCYGPVYPLSDMFEQMEKKDCDFWGITKNFEYCNHIQSYFICINKKMFSSAAFKEYWRNLTLYDDYWDEVRNHEIKFTNHFENLGFISDCFIDFDFIKEMQFDSLLYPEILLERYKLPLIKRKSFINNYEITKIYRFSSSLPNILTDYIVKNTDYDINMIYQDIIAVHPMSVIQDFFNLYYVLPSKFINSENSNTIKKIALILHIYYEDLIDYCLKYVKSLPGEGKTDIYIVSSKQNVLDICEEKSKLMPGYNFIFRLKENRGRDVSAYLVTCRDVFENYDLICCMHDKKSLSADTIFGMHYQNHCFENNLATKEYVQNIISLFNNNKYLGMLCPPPVVIAFRNKLGNNLEQLKILYKTLNLSIPFDNSPNAPFGSMFWIRKEAIKPLFRKDWKYEDFPEEPQPIDGTVSHAIERIYPAIAQEAGFLSAAVMPDFYAKILITNSLYENKKDNYFERTGRVKKIEKIFSVKNIYINNKKYKQIYIFGTKILKPVTTNTNNSFLENIFSVKNDNGKKHKVITILRLKFKIKNYIK